MTGQRLSKLSGIAQNLSRNAKDRSKPWRARNPELPPRSGAGKWSGKSLRSDDCQRKSAIGSGYTHRRGRASRQCEQVRERAVSCEAAHEESRVRTGVSTEGNFCKLYKITRLVCLGDSRQTPLCWRSVHYGTAGSAARQSEAIFIAVGTPQGSSGAADLSYVEAVVSQIAQWVNDYKVLVERSARFGLHERVDQLLHAASWRRASRFRRSFKS